jgi:endonuclease YncB( thermonuclease family)
MSVKSMINHEYELLTMSDDEKDIITSSAPITVRILEREIHMLQALAEFFGKSRASFGAQLLEQSIAEAFTYLPAEDREKVAEKADKAFQSSKGYWSNEAHHLSQIEQRKPQEVAA